MQRNSIVRLVTSLDTLPVFVIKGSKYHSSLEDQRLIHYKQDTIYAQERPICGHSEDYSSSDDSFCLQIKVQHTQASLKKMPTPVHLITNLANR